MFAAFYRPRTLAPILLILALGLVGCTEPKDPFDAIAELQSHNTKIERDIFALARERLETIENQCIRMYGPTGSKPDQSKLADCFNKIVENAFKADVNASEFTSEALKWTRRIFDNFRDEWLTGTNAQRAELKKKIIDQVSEALKKLAELPAVDKKKSLTTRIMKSATNELIRQDLITPGTTADLAATGRLLDPLGPGPIRVSFPVGAPNQVLINDPMLGQQLLQFSGEATLLARVDPTAPNVLQLQVTALNLTGSNLDFDAVSTGINQIVLNTEETSSGTAALPTGPVVLAFALTVTNAFLPEDVLFMNVQATGQIRTAGPDVFLDLVASGLAVAAFPSTSTPPPTEVVATVGTSGATLSLDEGTTIAIPPGALASPTEISLFMTAAILSQTAVPAGLDRVAATREVLPLNQPFNTPVTITLPYTGGDIAGLDESSLRALVFDEATRTWTLIPGSTVDVVADVVTFRLSNFASGYFGIGGSNISGDLDGDGDVDQTDLAIVLSARNAPANGATDPRDLNKDLRIDLLDARVLTTLCTRSKCATQ